MALDFFGRNGLFSAFILLGIVGISAQQSGVLPQVKQSSSPRVVKPVGEEEVKLLCKVKDAQNYTWYKNGKIILQPSARYTVKSYRFLRITDRVQKSDSGVFVCVATNIHGSANCTVKLIVEDPTVSPTNITGAAPKFTVSPDKLSRSLLALPVGNSVKLDCSAEGHPRPTVTWYKEGARFLKRKGGSRLYLGQWTLLLYMKDLVPTDTGKYTCNVSNAYGWINHTYYVDVHERARAEPVVLPMENVTVHVGENATLLCEALSDTWPHFQWLRWHSSSSNGTTNSTIEHPHYEVIKQMNIQDPDEHLVLPKSNKFDFHGVRLTLVNVTKKDEGKYTCIVGNAVGYAVEQAYIIVYRKNADKQEQNDSQKHENSTDGMPTVSAHKDEKPGKKSAWTSRIKHPKILIGLLAGVIVLAIITAGVCYWQVKKVRATSSSARSRRPEIDSLRAKYEVQNEYVVVPDYNTNV